MGNIEWMPIADLPEGYSREFLTHSYDIGYVVCEWMSGRIVLAWNQKPYTCATHWAEINPPSADPGIPVHPTALVEKGIPGLATIPERPAQCPICGELYAPSNAQDAAFHSGMHYRPATDDVLGKDGE